MLAVTYGRDVPPAMAELLEHHARAAGLSLGAVEALGASLHLVESFIVASEDGYGVEYARGLGLAPPDGQIERARWVAARLFG